MSIWTKEELEEQIALWKNAYSKASTGQSYSIGSRTLTRYNLPEIRDQLKYLESERIKMTTNRRPLMRVKARFSR